MTCEVSQYTTPVLRSNMSNPGTQEPCLCPKSGHIFPMEYEEVAANRAGSSMYLTKVDNHLYRLKGPLDGEDNKRFVYCYHNRITRHAQVKDKCYGCGVLDREAKTIRLTKPHNHEPDLRLLSRLRIRNKILQETLSSDAPLKEVFKNATLGEEGADLVGYSSISR